MFWYYNQWGRKCLIVDLSSAVKQYFDTSFAKPTVILREFEAVWETGKNLCHVTDEGHAVA